VGIDHDVRSFPEADIGRRNDEANPIRLPPHGKRASSACRFRPSESRTLPKQGARDRRQKAKHRDQTRTGITGESIEQPERQIPGRDWGLESTPGSLPEPTLREGAAPPPPPPMKRPPIDPDQIADLPGPEAAAAPP
jgi:hypothetical protein